MLSASGKKQLAFYDERNQTIRSADCSYLLRTQQRTRVNQVHRCHGCTQYRQTLTRMLYRIEHQEPKQVEERTNPRSHTNYRFLSSQEKTARLKNLHDQARTMQQKICMTSITSMFEYRQILTPGTPEYVLHILCR